MSSIVRLRITSYIGLVPGASHFFGELECDGHYVDLYRKLTRRQAAAINRVGRAGQTQYKPGENYPGFNRRLDVIEAARLAWRSSFPEATALYLVHLGELVPLDSTGVSPEIQP